MEDSSFRQFAEAFAGYFRGRAPQVEAEIFDLLESARVLVVGAGGLGNQIVKALVLSGVREIDLVDMDTMEISNLNRQVLFRDEDVGKPKAEIVAQRVCETLGADRVAVRPHVAMLQTFPAEFFTQFNLVLSGLDNIEARRWLNNVLCQLVQFDTDAPSGAPRLRPESVVPLIDGGTEAFLGHCRVILPGCTSCFECTIDLFPTRANVPVCTVIDRPRIAEHCIQYALVVSWPRHWHDSRSPDFDNDEDLDWLFAEARKRADMFSIAGVTRSETLSVLKKIVPAIATTNQIIGGMLVNEGLKVLTGFYPIANTYTLYNGSDGTTTSSMSFERRKDCPVCSESALVGVECCMPKTATLRAFLGTLTHLLTVTNPTVRTSESTVIYPSLPESIRVLHEFKLDKTLGELQEGEYMPTGSRVSLVVDGAGLETTRKVCLVLT